MKNIIKFITCLSLCLTLTACSEKSGVDDDAVSSFVDAIVNLKDVNSLNYDANVKIKATSSTSKANMNGSIMDLDTSLQLSFALDFQSDENESNKLVEYYMTKDATYLNLMGMKQKSVHGTSMEEITSLIKEPMNPELMKEIIKPYLISATKEGNLITFEIDAKKIASLDQVNQFIGTMAFDTITAQFTLQDGLLETISLNGIITDTNTKETTEIVGNVNILDINQVKTIKFPDLSSYGEMPTF